MSITRAQIPKEIDIFAEGGAAQSSAMTSYYDQLKDLYKDPINPSMDGNTVELAVEQMEFSENVVRYQTTLSFLNRRISGLMSAIKGE